MRPSAKHTNATQDSNRSAITVLREERDKPHFREYIPHRYVIDHGVQIDPSGGSSTSSYRVARYDGTEGDNLHETELRSSLTFRYSGISLTPGWRDRSVRREVNSNDILSSVYRAKYRTSGEWGSPGVFNFESGIQRVSAS